MCIVPCAIDAIGSGNVNGFRFLMCRLVGGLNLQTYCSIIKLSSSFCGFELIRIDSNRLYIVLLQVHFLYEACNSSVKLKRKKWQSAMILQSPKYSKKNIINLYATLISDHFFIKKFYAI